MDACRVLELGCGDGGNLIPMAQALPGSRFLGIDISTREIADGHRFLETLNLSNIELRALSIMEINESFGKFDYIICHGVFSWVPREVQDKILEICEQQLSPHGVAYISYNTYPGWHMRGAIRDMMLFHTKRFETPQHRAQQARAFLDFLAKSVSKNKGSYELMLNEEVGMLRNSGDSYLIHDHLADINEPFYFHEFIRRAGEHRLRYLAESEVYSMGAHTFPAAVQTTLRKLSPNLIESEQYLDFLRNRMFPQTLLTHAAAPVNHAIPVERIHQFLISSGSQAAANGASPRGEEGRAIPALQGENLQSRHQLLNAALEHLETKWPQAVSFDELRKAARVKLGSDTPDQAVVESDTRELGSCLLACYTVSKTIDLHVHIPQFTTAASEHPTASPFARWQATQSAKVTNLRHENLQLTEIERRVLPLLDGTRNSAALASIVAPDLQPALQRTATDALLARLARRVLLLT